MIKSKQKFNNTEVKGNLFSFRQKEIQYMTKKKKNPNSDFTFTKPSEIILITKPLLINCKRKALNDDHLKNFRILQASSIATMTKTTSRNFAMMKLRTCDEGTIMQLQADIMRLVLKTRREFYSQQAMSIHPSNVQSLSHHARENVLSTIQLQPLQPFHYPNIPSTSSAASDCLSASDDSLNIIYLL